MIVKIEEGTLKVITDVKQAIVARNYDEKGNVIDEYGFSYNPAQPKITANQFVGNAIIDGKIAYITQVDTDDEKVKDYIKACYGTGLVRANRFEATATEIVRQLEAEKARFDTELDIIVNGDAAPTIQPEALEPDEGELTAEPDEPAVVPGLPDAEPDEQ